MAEGTAFLDACGTCVGGDTGRTACVEDCNGDAGGEAVLDACGTCVGGNTDEVACVEDCNGDFGGSAVVDACGVCAGGTTGVTACVEDCNDDLGGTAFVDECGSCVGGETGAAACVEDCNGDFGGTAFVDECGACVGGETGAAACVQDCHGDFGGTAELDACGGCAGGNTGLCTGACGEDRLDEPGTHYLSFTTFDFVHPHLYAVDAENTSIFGEVKRALSGLAWLEAQREVEFPAGRWAIETRLAQTRELKWELRLEPEEERCGVHASVTWTQPGRGPAVWMVSPERLVFEATETCSVAVHLLAIDDPHYKNGTRLDWVRIRHACTADSDCPAVDGSPLAVCASEVCRYYEACPGPQ